MKTSTFLQCRFDIIQWKEVHYHHHLIIISITIIFKKVEVQVLLGIFKECVQWSAKSTLKNAHLYIAKDDDDHYNDVDCWWIIQQTSFSLFSSIECQFFNLFNKIFTPFSNSGASSSILTYSWAGLLEGSLFRQKIQLIDQFLLI